MRDEWGDLIEKEIMKDAERIMEEVNADPALKDVEAPEAMHDILFEKIREYEEQRKLEQLSDEDKELIRLGKVYRRRRKWSRYLVLVVAVVIVFAVGTVCIGEDKNVFRVISALFDGGEKTEINSEDVEPILYVEEDEAYEEIEERYGFIPVKLEYLPDNATFCEATFSEAMQHINMIYEINDDASLVYMIRPNYRESSIGTILEDEKVQEYHIFLKNVQITLIEYNIVETGENKWSVSFVHQDVQYLIRINNMKQEEVEQIISNLRFLE